MNAALIAALLSTPLLATAPAPAAPAVAQSTAPAQLEPADIYTADKLRDPFVKLNTTSGSAAPAHAFTIDDFNIHNLQLRGMMRDGRSGYAIFVDPSFGVTFMLRSGRLFNEKGKTVPGVTGALDIRRKTAHLMTKDSDVQIFRLGEDGAP